MVKENMKKGNDQPTANNDSNILSMTPVNLRIKVQPLFVVGRREVEEDCSFFLLFSSSTNARLPVSCRG